MNAFAVYGALTDLAGLFAGRYLRWRAGRGREDPARLAERFGHASRPRPAGPLVWAHGASVGEALALLPVIERLLAQNSAVAILLTTGTVTSARLLAARLQPRTIHQFVPIDHRPSVRRFMDYWKPDLALFIESELWPNLLLEADRQRIPRVLLNGRMSDRSYRRWQAWPALSRPIFARFALVLAQDNDQADHFRRLEAPHVDAIGDLKAAASKLPVDELELMRFRQILSGRPVWLAASTHPGEDKIVAAVHLALRATLPDLLTILAPRHPARAAAIAAELESLGLTVARRSLEQFPDAGTDFYLVDTLGDMGLVYRLAPVVLIAGSLGPPGSIGGHNPLEAAGLGCAVLHGPDTRNCAAMTALLDDEGAALSVTGDPQGLAENVGALLGDPERVARMGQAGQQVARAQSHVLDAAIRALMPFLERL